MTQDVLLGQLFFEEESMEVKRMTEKKYKDKGKSQITFYLINSSEKESLWRKTSGNKTIFMLLRQSTQPRWRSKTGSIKSITT